MIKNKIIISILNKLGIGVNAYVPKNTSILVNMLRKLLPDMDISYSQTDNVFHIIIDNEIGIDYTIDGSRVTKVEIIER